jgi:hypothetical protein
VGLRITASIICFVRRGARLIRNDPRFHEPAAQTSRRSAAPVPSA